MNHQMRTPPPVVQAAANNHCHFTLTGVIGLLVLSFIANAQTDSHSATRSLSASAEIRFQGMSTLHDFEGHVSSQPFVLVLTSNTWSAKADVVAEQMTTAHDRRDRNLWKMLAASIFPRLSGEVQPSPIPSPGGTNVMLLLRIRDEQHSLPVQITGWRESSEAIQFHAAWDVSLKHFGLKPPSVIGVIRVGDRVHLDAQITARNTTTTTNVPANNPVLISNP